MCTFTTVWISFHCDIYIIPLKCDFPKVLNFCDKLKNMEVTILDVQSIAIKLYWQIVSPRIMYKGNFVKLN